MASSPQPSDQTTRQPASRRGVMSTSFPGAFGGSLPGRLDAVLSGMNDPVSHFACSKCPKAPCPRAHRPFLTHLHVPLRPTTNKSPECPSCHSTGAYATGDLGRLQQPFPRGGLTVPLCLIVHCLSYLTHVLYTFTSTCCVSPIRTFTVEIPPLQASVF